MQRIMRDRLSIRYSKVELLIIMWNKLREDIFLKACVLKDYKMKAMLKNIALVPENIKRWVLTAYLFQCRHFHTIAFF